MSDTTAPVGYYCDHSDEPIGERTHHSWELVEGEGWVFQHQPDTISSHGGTQDYLTPQQQEQRCPRAVAVYTADVVEQARRIAVELENENSRLTSTDPWQRATDGLNALADAGIGFWIEPDGHISNPAGDEHIEYDHETERWQLVHDEEDI